MIDDVPNELICFPTSYPLNYPSVMRKCPRGYFVINNAEIRGGVFFPSSSFSFFSGTFSKNLNPRCCLDLKQVDR